jgi:probable F420-dependent oxidoreductase
MAAIVPAGQVGWGMQLPVQSQSTAFVQPWEADAGPAELARVAVAADRAGAFYVAVCDHIAIPRPLDETMGAVWYDTIATLGWLAAQTESVHLLSHVYVVPYRAPLITAKAFSTLDLLSGGRAILGVGIGHVEREFELVGAEFRRRGRDLDAALPVLREALATGEFEGAVLRPRSPRPGGTPIWVGGSSDAALRRAATLGDGWLPQGPPKMGMRAAVEFLRTERAEAFGADEPFDIGIQSEPIYVGTPTWDSGPFTLSGEPEAIAARLTKYVGVGANHVQVRFAARSAEEMADQVAAFGAEVWPLVGGPTG